MNRVYELLVAALISMTLLAQVAPVRAHPDLDEGRRLTSELEFEPALAAFDRALASGSLTREELIELLSERALSLHALQRQTDLLANFVWLSALSPDHHLDLRVPPELVALWISVRDRGHGALKVTLTAQADARGELSAKVSLSGTVPEGARARIVLRRPDGYWWVANSPELSRALPEKGLELYAEALGLGSVTVARDHGPDSPLRVRPGDAPQATTLLEPSQPSASRAKRYRSTFIGCAVAAVAVAAVAVVLATRGSWGGQGKQGEGRTVLKPMVSF